ncbi:class I SAM-dependent methyltransferase [Sabulicella glaciei]|uniref:Class I SAM-dependent methyltransferase n=1 Tax=Sabulicella glaciei TaxID=2984948 RepID=A0ABT3NVM0_9PROT|nr:class I SAM-dependent methyltransferase [Roseococcus sp. MDT2-1-1]
MSGLWAEFLTNGGRSVHKWAHYFPAYERHLARYVNRPCRMLEIGCAHGGSLQLWKRWLGPLAQIVGVDIQPGCAAYAEHNIAIRIGDQGDSDFLAKLHEEFGPFDVVLDDGSHRQSDIATSFGFLYPRMARDGVYMVEDLHTAYWPEYGGGLRNPASFLETCKHLVDELNAVWTKGALPPTEFTHTTLSMHFYDSIVAFERGATPPRVGPQIPPVEVKELRPPA